MRQGRGRLRSRWGSPRSRKEHEKRRPQSAHCRRALPGRVFLGANRREAAFERREMPDPAEPGTTEIRTKDAGRRRSARTTRSETLAGPGAAPRRLDPKDLRSEEQRTGRRGSDHRAPPDPKSPGTQAQTTKRTNQAGSPAHTRATGTIRPLETRLHPRQCAPARALHFMHG